MIKINNEPHLYTLTKKIYKNGFSDIILSLNYKKNYIKNYFDKKKLPIKYCEEKKSLGTAGPIKLAFKKKMDMPNLIKKAIIKRKNVESFYLFENWIDFGSRSELKKILSK